MKLKMKVPVIFKLSTTSLVVLVLFFVLYFLFRDRISLCNQGWNWNTLCSLAWPQMCSHFQSQTPQYWPLCKNPRATLPSFIQCSYNSVFSLEAGIALVTHQNRHSFHLQLLKLLLWICQLKADSSKFKNSRLGRQFSGRALTSHVRL